MEKTITNIAAEKLIVIGGSAGSLEIVLLILENLVLNKNVAVIIVLHRKNTDGSPLIELLNFKSDFPVKEAEDKELILAQNIYVAPPDYHLLVENDFTISLDCSEKINYSRPSIDVTFESVADVYKTNTTALLLSGANSDGTDGLIEIFNIGGTTLIQDPETADVDYMPRHALSKINPTQVLKPAEIAPYFNNIK